MDKIVLTTHGHPITGQTGFTGLQEGWTCPLTVACLRDDGYFARINLFLCVGTAIGLHNGLMEF